MNDLVPMLQYSEMQHYAVTSARGLSDVGSLCPYHSGQKRQSCSEHTDVNST